MSRDEVAGRLMRAAIYLLASAADDVAAGRYSADERAHLADGLDQLSIALRGDAPGDVRAPTTRGRAPRPPSSRPLVRPLPPR